MTITVDIRSGQVGATFAVGRADALKVRLTLSGVGPASAGAVEMCGHCLGGRFFVHDHVLASARGTKVCGVCPAGKVAEKEIGVVENIQQRLFLAD